MGMIKHVDSFSVPETGKIFFEEKLEDSLQAAIGHTPVLGSPAPLNTLFLLH